MDQTELRGVLSLASLVDYQEGAVVSKTLIKESKGSVTIFSFDEGQEFSEHTVPHDALVQVLDGEAEITISGTRHRLQRDQMIVMPGGEPHAVKATRKFKMLLTLIRA
jgi:quercetin dioxygenase-like cupin family protein